MKKQHKWGWAFHLHLEQNTELKDSAGDTFWKCSRYYTKVNHILNIFTNQVKNSILFQDTSLFLLFFSLTDRSVKPIATGIVK